MYFETLIFLSVTTISAIMNYLIYECLYDEQDNIHNKEIKILFHCCGRYKLIL